MSYLRSARTRFGLSGANLIIESAKGGGPLAIAQRAVQRARDLGLRRKGPEKLDEAWVIFDAETAANPAARKAVHLALGAGLKIGLSNPCFEVWLLLHRAEQHSSMTAKKAKERCERLLGIPGPQEEPPQFDDPRLGATWETAAENAEKCRKRVVHDENLADTRPALVVLARNPGSNLDELFQTLDAARPGRAVD